MLLENLMDFVSTMFKSLNMTSVFFVKKIIGTLKQLKGGNDFQIYSYLKIVGISQETAFNKNVESSKPHSWGNEWTHAIGNQRMNLTMLKEAKAYIL